MAITVKVDMTKHVAATREFQKKQLPFVTAATLTAVAQDAQAATKGQVRKAFTLRNSWTEQGIRIKPAQKNGTNGTITADVHTDTANRKTGAPDYLGRQEDGGEKVPFGGRHFIAVPTPYLRKMAPGVIPAELRPKALVGAVGGRYTARTRKGQIALRSQRIVNGFVFFLYPTPENPKYIMGRYFTDRKAFPFYTLTPHVTVKKSALHMQETVQKTVDNNFSKRWDETWQKAFARGIKL